MKTKIYFIIKPLFFNRAILPYHIKILRPFSTSFSSSYTMRPNNVPSNCIDIFMSGLKAIDCGCLLDELQSVLTVLRHYNGVIWVLNKHYNSKAYVRKDFTIIFDEDVLDLQGLIFDAIEEAGNKPKQVNILLNLWPSGYNEYVTTSDKSNNIYLCDRL